MEHSLGLEQGICAEKNFSDKIQNALTHTNFGWSECKNIVDAGWSDWCVDGFFRWRMNDEYIYISL